MKSQPSIDRGILIPIGISVLSIAGIGLLLLIVYFETPKATPLAEPTTTPFKYLFLATESHTPEPGLETVTPEESFSLTTPIASDFVITQDGTGTLDANVLPQGTSTSSVEETLVFMEGKYDDIDDRIIYEGDWVSEIVDIAYQETLFISTLTGNTAAFIFSGTQMQIGYLEDPGLGTVIVSIDGVDYPLDQSDGFEWLSPELPFGEHSILLTHESGELIILDYIIIIGSE